MRKFVITKRKNEEYQFNLKASNGEVILTSEGYSTKAGCKNGIDSVKVNALLDARYEKLVAKNGQYYFNLKAGNGEIIGTSQMYNSSGSRDNGISSVKSSAPDATVVDETL